MEAHPAQIARAMKVAPTPALQLEERQNLANPTEASLIAVLVTGIPNSILNLAISNPPELYSLLQSDFIDGTYPEWYNDLPLDVQCYLTEGTVCPASQLDDSTTSSTRSPRPTNSSQPEGLSTGAKAGIGVGVALGVLLLIGGLIFCCFMQRRKKKQRIAQQSQIPPPIAPMPMQQQAPQQQQQYDSPAYYQKVQPYPQQQHPQQQPTTSPVSDYSHSYNTSSPGGYSQQPYSSPYPPPQQQYPPSQEPYQQHPPPLQQQPPHQQQGQYAQELPSAQPTRPHELS